MSASLVGSEMCIRDSCSGSTGPACQVSTQLQPARLPSSPCKCALPASPFARPRQGASRRSASMPGPVTRTPPSKVRAKSCSFVEK
eukprot:6335258-Alexandrium_andersonii.AAC.1